MKTLEMSDLTTTRRKTSGNVHVIAGPSSRKYGSVSVEPVPTLAERAEQLRDGIKRVIVAIWTAHA